MTADKIITLAFAIVIVCGILYTLIKTCLPLIKDMDFWTKIFSWIVKAEQSANTGEEKLNYVMEQGTNYAREKGVDINLTLLKKMINKIIELTKQVNV